MTNMNEQMADAMRGLEIEMMQDLYTRVVRTCHSKCIGGRYYDQELSKGQSICVDRCVSKFIEVHDRVGKILTANPQMNDQNNSDVK
ncbi:hypothetical protein ACOME3_006570 [Neoechinorhynchus agilis]